MQLVLTSNWDEAVASLSERLVSELAAGRRVLWLVSGGSNVKASVLVMERISDDLSPGLSVLPVDERYGAPGHPESNLAQLMAAGFSPKAANLLPVLADKLDFTQALERYNDLAEQSFAANDIIIAQLGIGVDGHIAGILPNSAATSETSHWVISYEAEPYERLTLTFPALRKISVAYALAFGDNKRGALQNLRDQVLSLQEQPAQILKAIAEAYVYNDQLGDSNE